MAVPIPVVHAGLGVLCILLSLPLILRLVPMNRWFGVRIEKALTSSPNWYAVNAYAGKWLLGFGLFLVGFSALSHPFAPSPRSVWAPVYLVAPLLGFIALMSAIRRYASRLPD